MKRRSMVACVCALALWTAAAQIVHAADPIPFELVVKAGRTLPVTLDKTIRLDKVGQPVTGILSEPIYSYDRIVVPAGTAVTGHVERLAQTSRRARLNRFLRGDFSPVHVATLRFDSLELGDGSRTPIDTRVTLLAQNVSHQVAGDPKKHGAVDRARVAATQKISEMRQSITAPGRLRRLKEFAVNQLPYHPQYLRGGAAYAAELLTPLSFGTGVAIERAPAGTAPPPDSILHARLITPLDSSKSARGTRITAIITEPLLDSNGRLIIPEGTELEGEVTVALGARHFHRNGQLRFLFENIRLPEQEPQTLLGSLYATDLSGDDHLVIDNEGGAKIANVKTRFVAPALATLGAAATFMNDTIDTSENPNVPIGTSGANVGGRGAGGFAGLGIAGVLAAQASRQVGIAFGVAGVMQAMYGTFLGKGRDISFPADTSIEIRLSPNPSPIK